MTDSRWIDIPPVGTYRHYKGGIYEVCFMSTHTETGELLVNYHDKDGKHWSRPATMWFEDVEYEGEIIQRFTPIKIQGVNQHENS